MTGHSVKLWLVLQKMQGRWFAELLSVGNEKIGPDNQWTDGELLTPETQQRVTWADVVKTSTNSKF